MQNRNWNVILSELHDAPYARQKASRRILGLIGFLAGIANV